MSLLGSDHCQQGRWTMPRQQLFAITKDCYPINFPKSRLTTNRLSANWGKSDQNWSDLRQNSLGHIINCLLKRGTPHPSTITLQGWSQRPFTGHRFPSPQAALIPAGEPEAATNELLSKSPIILHCCSWKKDLCFPFPDETALECCLHDLLQRLVIHGKHWMDNEAEGKQ